MQSEQQLSLPLVDHGSSEGPQKAVLDRAKAEVGFVPNMYAGMVNSPGLLETYLTGYKLFREESGFTPPEQEVIFLTISRNNGCTYCVSAHSMLAEKASKLDNAVTEAIRTNQPIEDAKLAALSRFTNVMVDTRGLPSQAEMQAFLDAGYSERHILEVVLAISVKTLSNYANHLFHTPLDDVFGAYAWTDHKAAA
ncbi:MAG: carboxymuconolactone decarboxylase family protein [Geminicoccaceae bacterium]